MQLDIQQFLTDAGISEPLYPGKRLVKKLPQPGDYKSHCVIFDWRDAKTLRLDIKAGLQGRDLLKKDSVKFPVSFQVPTYVEIEAIANDDNREEDKREDEDEGEGSAGSASGGGQAMARRAGQMFNAFSAVVDGKVPALGEIRKLVVLGKTIAKEAFAPVFEALVAQIKNLSIVPVNLLAAAGSAAKLTVATPGGRELTEMPQHLVQAADVKYAPKDMFGVGGPT